MKLWGGRFEKATDGMVDDFHSSISFDKRLYKQDIRGSIAHATMLGEQGIIPKEDADKIVEGLKGILADIDAGHVQFEVDAEDIHMNVEKLLTEPNMREKSQRLCIMKVRITLNTCATNQPVRAASSTRLASSASNPSK